MRLRPGLRRDPTAGAYTAHPDLLAGFQGDASRQGRARRGSKGEGSIPPLLFLQFNHRITTKSNGFFHGLCAIFLPNFVKIGTLGYSFCVILLTNKNSQQMNADENITSLTGIKIILMKKAFRGDANTALWL